MVLSRSWIFLEIVFIDFYKRVDKQFKQLSYENFLSLFLSSRLPCLVGIACDIASLRLT